MNHTKLKGDSAIANQRYSNLFLLSVVTLLFAILLLPSYSYAFNLGGFESMKGLHLNSANSFLSLGMNHQSGLMLGFDIPAFISVLDPTRFPGLKAIVQISPLLVLVAFVFLGCFRFYMALKPVVAGYGVATDDLLNAAIGLIFIAVGFIMFNVIIAATDEILRLIG